MCTRQEGKKEKIKKIIKTAPLYILITIFDIFMLFGYDCLINMMGWHNSHFAYIALAVMCLLDMLVPISGLIIYKIMD